jgi:hypothetical protein
MADDPLGVRALITARMTLAEFGRAMSSTSGTVNHWIARGIPGNRVFRAADVLEMKPDELRRYTSEALKPPADVEAEFKAFSATFRQLEADQQARMIASLQRMVQKR